MAIFTLVVLAIAGVLFLFERIPPAIVSLSIPVVLVVAGILTPEEALSPLSRPITVMFAGMFVIGAGLFRSGLASVIGQFVVSLLGKRCSSLVASVMMAGGILSALLSNTGTTAVLIPVVRGVGITAGLGHRRLLLPLAYGATLGGLLTLIGTPMNLVVQAALIDQELEPFGFFEFGLLGVPLLAVGTLYMVLVGRFMIRELHPCEPVPCDENSTSRHPLEKPDSRRGKWVSGLVLLGTVAMMVGGWVPISIAALAGALLIVILGCLRLDEAIRSMEWTAIFLFSGMLALSDAMAKTGADRLMVNAFLGVLGPTPHPIVVLGAVAFAAWFVTQFMPNTASAAIMAPVGLAIGNTLGMNPHALMMAVVVGATCALSTPIGTPPNTLVYGISGYRFTDYLRVGIPLSALLLATAILLITQIWPSHAT